MPARLKIPDAYGMVADNGLKSLAPSAPLPPPEEEWRELDPEPVPAPPVPRRKIPAWALWAAAGVVALATLRR